MNTSTNHTSTSELSQLRAEIERLDKAATPGPWEIDKYNAVPDAPYVWTGSGLLELVAKTWHDDPERGAANRDFIAFARTALPRLLAIATEMEK